MKFYKHKTSIIDKNCTIGKNSKIWHWSHISKNSKIGSNCVIGQNVFIGENVKIGDNVKIQNNVSVYQGITIENDVFCGPSVVFTNVKYPTSTRKVKKKNYEKTLIKKGATLGANSTIICGLEIGENAIVGAGSVVTKKIKNNLVVAGNPACEIGKVCSCKIKIYKKPYKKNIKCNICGVKKK
tara:strand:- start:556 stop:1104 length:549 start_codon:yes stop_codon:yes gene_type:complete